MSASHNHNDDDSDDWEIVSPEEARRLGPRGTAQTSTGDDGSRSDGGPSTRFSFEVNFLGLSCSVTATDRRNGSEGGQQLAPTTSPPPRVAGPQSATPTPANPQTQSPLFALPTELRLQIWDHLLTLPAPSTSTVPFYGIPMSSEPTLCPNHQTLRPPTVLSILQTCRLAHTETHALFYALNRLHTDPRIPAARLSPPRRAAITALTMTVTAAPEMAGVAQALRTPVGALAGLRSLWFVRTQTVKFLDPRAWAVMSYQTAEALRGAKGGGRGPCGRLEAVKVITPEGGELTEAERERWARLRVADERVEAAVRG